MPRVEADFQHLPGYPVPVFNRLIGVGIGPHRDPLRLVAGLRQLLCQQPGRIGFGKQLGLKIQTRRQVVIGVGRAGKAIHAAMLAAAIGVDRPVEGNVGRTVETEDGFGKFLGHGGAQFYRRPVERLRRVTPVAVRLTLRKAEALRDERGLRASASDLIFRPFRHKNKYRTSWPSREPGIILSIKQPERTQAVFLLVSGDF